MKRTIFARLLAVVLTCALVLAGIPFVPRVAQGEEGLLQQDATLIQDEEAQSQKVSEPSGEGVALPAEEELIDDPQTQELPDQQGLLAVSDAEDNLDSEEGEPTPDDGEDEDVPTPEEEMDAYAAEHEGDLADGRYAIASMLGNDLALDVNAASKADGARIIIWTAKAANNQRWDIKSVGGGYVTITSVASGKALDVKGGNASSGASVIQWAKKSIVTRNQLWVIARQESGAYTITSAMPGADGTRLVLDVSGASSKAGTSTCIYKEHAEACANQQWDFVKPWDLVVDDEARAHKGDLADGTYLIASALGSDLVLDVSGSSVSGGAKVIVWPAQPATNECWMVSHDATGYVIFTCVKSGMVLDVNGGAAKNGASAIQWAQKTKGASNQKWIAERQDDGTYRIVSAMTGARLVLDVKGGAAQPGAAVILWQEGQDKPNQAFTFEEAPTELRCAVRNGAYALRPAGQTTNVLDVQGGSTKEGSKVGLWQRKDTKNANQVWKLTYDNAGNAHLTSALSKLELSLGANGAVQVSKPQGWVLVSFGGGKFTLRDVATGCYLASDGEALQVVSAETYDESCCLWEFVSTEVAQNSVYESDAEGKYAFTYLHGVGYTTCHDRSSGRVMYGYKRFGTTELHFDELTGAMDEDGFQTLAAASHNYVSEMPVLEDVARAIQRGARVRILGDSISVGQGVGSSVIYDGTVYAQLSSTTYREPSYKTPCYANALREYLAGHRGSLLNASVSQKDYAWFDSFGDALPGTESHYDLTLILLGTNDRTKSQAELTASVASVLDKAQASSGKVVVMLPPPTLDGKSFDTVRSIVEVACRLRGIETIDLYTSFYGAADVAGFAQQLLFADSIHPSLVGQAVMWGIVSHSLGISQ